MNYLLVSRGVDAYGQKLSAENAVHSCHHPTHVLQLVSLLFKFNIYTIVANNIGIRFPS